MAREKQKLTKQEKIDKSKDFIKMQEELKDRVLNLKKVQSTILLLSDEMLSIKKDKSTIDETGRPSYMYEQRYWDIATELDEIRYNEFTRPELDKALIQYESDIVGIDAAINSEKKEMEKNQ